MYSESRKKGNKAEDLACARLKYIGFSIIERNYLRKWGEIDIIAKRGKYLYFFEVKSIKVNKISDISASYHPEYNFSSQKRRKMQRTIQIYMVQNKVQNEHWKFFLASVYIEKRSDNSKIAFIEEVL